MKKEEKQGETTIFRYQSADEILKIIQSGIGEEEAKAAHKPQKKQKKNMMRFKVILLLQKEK